MKVIHTDYMGRKREISLEQAVKSVCDGSDYDRGTIETLQVTIRLQGEMIARIIEHMPHGTIAAVLGPNFSVLP